MWTHRLFLFCSADDVEALTDLAIEVGSQAESRTFHEVLPGWYGCNTAATEEIRQSLNDGLSNLLASGTIGTIYIARLDNATDILQSSYSASPSENVEFVLYGEFGGSVGAPFTWKQSLEALQTIENIT